MLDARKPALCDRRPVRRDDLAHHGNRGVHYISIRYTERLVKAGIEPSMGTIGASYDNALAETINGLFKASCSTDAVLGGGTEAVELATLEWVDWFNHRRLFEPIGNVPLAEAKARFDAKAKDLAMVAWRKPNSLW